MGLVSFPVSLFVAIGILGLLVGGTCLLKARHRANSVSTPEYPDKVLVWCGISSPLIATALYLVLGNPDYQDQPFATRSESVLVQKQQPAMSPLSMLGLDNLEGLSTQELITKIKDVLPTIEGTPQETMGWMILGQTYTKIAEYDNAIDAYQNALDKVQNPQMKLKIQMEYLMLLKTASPDGLTGTGLLLLQDLKSYQDTNPEIKQFLSNF